MTPPDPLTQNDPQRWMDRARSDLALARSRPEGVHLADLCFHSQQAAEKAIKALLVARGIEFPYVHDLVFLLSLLGDAGHATPEPVKLVRELTRYASATRYPGLEDRVSDQQYADALRIAEVVIRWAEDNL